MKITYYTLDGVLSTAYCDEPVNDIAHGTDKYTDESVTVRWNGVDSWIQIYA